MRFSLRVWFTCLCVFGCVSYSENEGAAWEEVGCQEILLDHAGDWCDDVNKPFNDMKDGEFSVKGNVHFMCAHTFKVKPGKKYSFTAEVIANEKLTKTVTCGYILSDSLHRRIHGKHYLCLPDSLTELAAPATEEQDFILVKNNPKWMNRGTQGFNLVAFNVKADFGDLPNMEISSQIKSVVEEGGNLKVIFDKMLYKKYPAGTLVRIHGNAPFYFIAGRVFPNEQWQKVGGAFDFPANAEYFYPCLIYYGDKDKVVKFRNMRLVVD